MIITKSLITKIFGDFRKYVCAPSLAQHSLRAVALRREEALAYSPEAGCLDYSQGTSTGLLAGGLELALGVPAEARLLVGAGGGGGGGGAAARS